MPAACISAANASRCAGGSFGSSDPTPARTGQRMCFARSARCQCVDRRDRAQLDTVTPELQRDGALVP